MNCRIPETEAAKLGHRQRRRRKQRRGSDVRRAAKWSRPDRKNRALRPGLQRAVTSATAVARGGTSRGGGSCDRPDHDAGGFAVPVSAKAVARGGTSRGGGSCDRPDHDYGGFAVPVSAKAVARDGTSHDGGSCDRPDHDAGGSAAPGSAAASGPTQTSRDGGPGHDAGGFDAPVCTAAPVSSAASGQTQNGIHPFLRLQLFGQDSKCLVSQVRAFAEGAPRFRRAGVLPPHASADGRAGAGSGAED
jgi:hypothetical protein